MSSSKSPLLPNVEWHEVKPTRVLNDLEPPHDLNLNDLFSWIKIGATARWKAMSAGERVRMCRDLGVPVGLILEADFINLKDATLVNHLEEPFLYIPFSKRGGRGTFGEYPAKPTTSASVLEPFQGRAQELTATRVLSHISTWQDLSEGRRRDLASAVERVKRLVRERPDLCGDVSPDDLSMDCATLNRLLYAAPARSLGFEPSRFGNVVSALRFILRRLGRHAPEETGTSNFTPAWRHLHAALPTRFRQIPLIGFMRFCSAWQVEPELVTTQVLVWFERWCAAATIDDDIRGKVRRTASNWTWARAHVSGWPQAELTRPNQKEHYTLPLEAYPASFQADVRLYAKRLANRSIDDVFSGEAAPTSRKPRSGGPVSFRSRAPAKQRTVETRVSGIRFAAAALVLSGHSPDSLTSLRDLVEPPDRPRKILSFHRNRLKRQRKERAKQGERADGSEIQSTHLANIGEVLRQIAHFHCGLPDSQVDRITELAKLVSPPRQKTMCRRNRDRVRRLIEPRAKALLLHLPEHLMEQAADPNLKPADGARFALYATALEILLICPLRRRNLAELDITRSLCRDGGRRSLINRLYVPADEVKNESEIDWPVPIESACLIQTYLTRHRPHLTNPTNSYLFPGAHGGARNAHELGIALSELVEREIGVPVNVHLLRHFAVWCYLNNNGGDYEVVRQVLGHSRIETTRDFYAGLEANSSARSFDANVLRERKDTQESAAAVYGARRHPMTGAKLGQGSR